MCLSLACLLRFVFDRPVWESVIVFILGFIGASGFRSTVKALKILLRDIQ